MAKFLSAQQTAAALISKFGSAVTLRRTLPGAFDPVTQSEIGETIASEQFTAVAVPPSQQAKYTVGTLEGRDALEVYFALKGRSMRPQPGDDVIMGGTTYRVFWAQTYDPALDGAIFTLGYVERKS